MSDEYNDFWIQMDGAIGWNRTKDDIKELVNDPLLWATNLIESATQDIENAPNDRGTNKKAWQQVNVALDVLKWLNDEDE